MNNGMVYAKNLININKLPVNAKVTTVLEESPDWVTPTFPPIDAKFTANFLQFQYSRILKLYVLICMMVILILRYH